MDKVKRKNSRRKGSTGELELAHKLSEYGFECRRTQQFCGRGGESADVIGLPYIHIECKRVEKLNIDEALLQAIQDHKQDTIPAVFHRKNQTPWKVTLTLVDFMKIYSEYYSSMEIKREGVEYDEESLYEL